MNRKRMLELTAAATLSAPCLLAGALAASEPAPARLADVQIIDRVTGERLPIYGHRAERWVAGVPGHRYSISVHNRSEGRLLAVMSVDGLNVLSGEAAGWKQRGYVFGAGEQYEISGWRKSLERIAAFEFASVPDSYAARTGQPDNIGVIGVALFREAVHPVLNVAPPAPAAEPLAARDRAQAGGAPSSQSSDLASVAAEKDRRAAVRPGLGTAHGQTETSRASVTDFERAQSSPDEVITIRYDRRDNLIAMGVIETIAPVPDPFPSSSLGFVPDPPAR
jgi:hypothetical protein